VKAHVLSRNLAKAYGGQKGGKGRPCCGGMVLPSKGENSVGSMLREKLERECAHGAARTSFEKGERGTHL